ncbi:MAG: TIGR04283 family arsenosugar biosynthesis glycosyltransferase [Desulfovibrio sp.]
MFQSKAVRISVIVPVLHESGRVAALAEHLRRMAETDGVAVQIVFVDGDPKGSTLAALPGAREGGIVGLCAGPGRGAQMNAGAHIADGEVLLFLHADSRLPEGAFQRIDQVVSNGLSQAGAFDLAFDDPAWRFRALAATARLRSRLERRPYGDQAHFFPRAVFFGLGGYPEIPLMEDVELMERVRRRRLTLSILPDRVTVSARRYVHEGFVRRIVRNLVLRAAHALGADPARLARWYRPHSDSASGDDQ